MSQTTSIILADDHSLVRDGIRALLESESDLEVVGEVSNGKEAVAMASDQPADLLIIDIRMPEMTGIEAVEELNRRGVPIKSIILSMHDSEEYILKSVNAGARGYLLKDTDKTEFIKAIHTVTQGGTYFSGDISNVLIKNILHPRTETSEYTEKSASGNNPFDLTGKELQVLRLVISGLTNKQIAEKLRNSKRTVETHRFNLMRKMEVKNLMDLAKKAELYKLQ